MSQLEEHAKKEELSPRQTLPEDFLECPKHDLIVLITRMLISLIKINDKYLPTKDLTSMNLTRFHSREPPSISVYDYLMRLARYNTLENSILIIAVYYIDLLTNSFQNFNLNSLTVHRFLLTATVVASKGLSDHFCRNEHYAKVGGIKVQELNFLEMEFLKRVNWRIVPRKESNDDIDKRRNSTDSIQSGSSSNSSTELSKKVPKRPIGIAYCSQVLKSYYKKMIDIVGDEQTPLNLNKPNEENQNIVYVLNEKSKSGKDETDDDRRKRHKKNLAE